MNKENRILKISFSRHVQCEQYIFGVFCYINLFSLLAISFPFSLTIKAQSDQGLSYQSYTACPAQPDALNPMSTVQHGRMVPSLPVLTQELI